MNPNRPRNHTIVVSDDIMIVQGIVEHGKVTDQPSQISKGNFHFHGRAIGKIGGRNDEIGIGIKARVAERLNSFVHNRFLHGLCVLTATTIEEGRSVVTALVAMGADFFTLALGVRCNSANLTGRRSSNRASGLSLVRAV